MWERIFEVYFITLHHLCGNIHKPLLSSVKMQWAPWQPGESMTFYVVGYITVYYVMRS